MHMVGQDDPCVDVERRARSHLAYSVTQNADVLDKKLTSAIMEIDRKEICAAWNPVAAIFGHWGVMPLGFKRREDRWVALRLPILLLLLLLLLHSSVDVTDNWNGVGGQPGGLGHE